MPVVVVVGDLPSTGHVPGASAVRLPLGRASGMTKDQFCAALGELHDQYDAVVCLCPTWRSQPAKHSIAMARMVHGTERITAVPCDLPPLGLSLTADLIAHLARYVPPGVLIALVRRLSRQIVAGAWLRSVTKLQHVPTGLSQHLGSYVPGSSFLALVRPEPTVTRIPAGRALAWRLQDPVHLLTTSANGDEKWLRSELAPALRPAVAQSLRPQPLSADYWGSKAFLEFVAFSAHPDALTHLVRSVRYRPCSWCGELVSNDPCPFCSMSASNASFQPSHTLPDSQSLPTPLVGATAETHSPAEYTTRSDHR